MRPLRRYASLLGVEATTGSLRTLGLLTLVVTVVLTLLAPLPQDPPGWADPLNFLLTATAFLAPLGAGSAALRTTTLWRSGVTGVASTSTRGPGAVALLACAAVGSWQVVSYTTGQVVYLLRCDTHGPFEPSMLLLPLLGVAVVLVSVALGAAAGRAWHSRLAAPAVAVLLFAVLYFASYATGAVVKVSVIYPAVYYRPELQPHAHLLEAQVMALLALGGLALTIVTTARVRAVLGALSGAVLVVGCLWLTQVSPDPVAYRPEPRHPPCATSEGTRLCVWPDYSAALPSALRALVAARAAARPYYPTPTTYEQVGLTGAGHGDAAELRIEDVTADPPDTGEDAAVAVAPPPCGGATFTASSDLAELVASRTGALTPVSEDIAHLLSQPLAQQRAWVDQRLRQVRDCPHAEVDGS